MSTQNDQPCVVESTGADILVDLTLVVIVVIGKVWQMMQATAAWVWEVAR